MTTMTVAERTVEQWRTTAGADNPAGPLYAFGAFAESEIVNAVQYTQAGQEALCSGSLHYHCY
jgi:hypothetical protein